MGNTSYKEQYKQYQPTPKQLFLERFIRSLVDKEENDIIYDAVKKQLEQFLPYVSIKIEKESLYDRRVYVKNKIQFPFFQWTLLLYPDYDLSRACYYASDAIENWIKENKLEYKLMLKKSSIHYPKEREKIFNRLFEKMVNSKEKNK